ncbi:ferrochelatase [Marinobacter lutaoensis]|jgi:ferrochelatase|uniref:Ferrochelatase n=1 Tax=Marinobacter lutaoensis TaxID=135739 RepID=A0A1V2DUN1_9GAMM|nr:ferrochelatase [Marinobacter lutaoensis]NVD35194.1 ferrochelatase [Marinobacter lutaoensis]ONF44170.1 ferrochelatase [Marinobacter lutaoensis]
MKYKGIRNFQHGQTERIGILITNLGTPDAPTPSALRRYLAEFLWDPRVVEAPRPLWWLILHGIILRVRPRRSAAAYAKVWQPEGSPLLLHTARQAEGIREALRESHGQNLVVAFAMRYGNPSIATALDELQAQGVSKLLVLPLYPQYSASTAGSTFDALAADFTRRRWLPDLRFVAHYHDFPPYIEAMARHIEAHWANHGRKEKLVLSYHGVPFRYLLQGDPYHCECHKTSRLLADRLGLSDEDYITTFQSRFGREEWLQPYTDETMKALPGQGVRSVDVFCPGFSSDCLETIEEINEENRGYFLDAGGESFSYIPALNATPGHIEALVKLIEENLKGWTLPDNRPETLAQRQQRATAIKNANYPGRPLDQL